MAICFNCGMNSNEHGNISFFKQPFRLYIKYGRNETVFNDFIDMCDKCLPLDVSKKTDISGLKTEILKDVIKNIQLKIILTR